MGAGRKTPTKRCGEGQQVTGGEIFFAELQEVDSGAGEGVSLVEKPLMSLTFIARKETPIGNGVLEHCCECTFRAERLSGIIEGETYSYGRDEGPDQARRGEDEPAALNGKREERTRA